MVITARFDSKCTRCGGLIRKGEKIEWSKGSKGAAHTTCPATPERVEEKPGYGKNFTADRDKGICHLCGKWVREGQKGRYLYPGKKLEHLSCESAAKTAEVEKSAAPYSLGGGSGYRCQGWTVGQTIRASEKHRAAGWPEFITVVKSSKRYVREDGLSCGVGDDSGYIYTASARAATEAEAAPVRARIEERARKAAAEAELTGLAKHIRESGECPERSDTFPEGERWFDTQTLYGGGSWWVVGPEWIWYVSNNGADGDCWANNNVRTGGAGAIGHRVPRTEELVEKLTRIRDTLAGKLERDAHERTVAAMVDDDLAGRTVGAY